MRFVAAGLALIACGIVGLGLISFADLINVFLEIAFNTRRTAEGPRYPALRTVSVIFKILAVVVWLAGVLLFFLVVAGVIDKIGG